ncbi:MAG: hypothetical protein JSS32_03155 [Verrucomicrobia bacterium]|nr:hypothetical protein [Verrucomicrobiota bacterium]
MNPTNSYLNIGQKALVSAGASVIQSVAISNLGSAAWKVGSIAFQYGFWPTVICGSILAGKTLYEYNKTENLKESFEKGIGVFSSAWSRGKALIQKAIPSFSNSQAQPQANSDLAKQISQKAKIVWDRSKETVVGIESGFFKLAKNLGGDRDAILLGMTFAGASCGYGAFFKGGYNKTLWIAELSAASAATYSALNASLKNHLKSTADSTNKDQEEEKVEEPTAPFSGHATAASSTPLPALSMSNSESASNSSSSTASSTTASN